MSALSVRVIKTATIPTTRGVAGRSIFRPLSTRSGPNVVLRSTLLRKYLPTDSELHVSNSSPSLPPGEPSNKHISVDENGVQQVDLSFIEEPLGLDTEQGYGYAELQFGETLDRGRLKVVRKLGWGLYGSIWLAHDQETGNYVAVKVLTGHATDLLRKGVINELAALETLTAAMGREPLLSFHCLPLLGQFKYDGGTNAPGGHLCLVTPILRGDVAILRKHLADGFSMPLAKRILRHTLKGIVHLHSSGIIHTDLKWDNVMFDTGLLTPEDIAHIIERDLPRRHPSEASWNGNIQAAVSQTLPMPSLEEAMNSTFVIGDFGSAYFLDHLPRRKITPLVLRAPETVLRGSWNEKVDIWVFGCLVFELFTRRPLFTYQKFKDDKHGIDMDPVECHLWQMLSLTGSKFSPEQLADGEKSDQYFDKTATSCIFRETIESCISAYNTMNGTDVSLLAAFIRRCLILDPKRRPSAEELLNDPWLLY